MSDKQTVVVGGSLERTLSDDFKINVRAIFKEAWKLNSDTQFVILQAGLMVLAIAMLLVMIGFKLLDVDLGNPVPEQQMFVIEVIVIAVLAPLLTGITVMGINHSVGARSISTHVFRFLSHALILGFAAVVINMLVKIGMIVIIPGLYLSAATGFTLALIVEKELSPINAAVMSIKVFNKHWLALLVFYGIFTLLFIGSLFTLFIGFIWTVPLYCNAKGILYRELFGVNMAVSDVQQKESNDESVFRA